MIRQFLVPLLVVLLGGCSITKFGNTFEGANDFRIVPLPITAAAPDCPLTAKMRPIRRDASRVALPLGCYSRFQRHPQPGVNKGNVFLSKNDRVAIFMKSMRFPFFTEGYLENWANGLFGSPVKGEIAIVANVTEGARSPGGRGSDGQLEGKVVYYSGDVLAGQQANEYNIPIYGPATYTGGALTIELWALELDEAESKQFGPVLKTLTQLSVEFLGLPGGANQVLSQIGSAFLNSNRDDVIGHIAITLVPPQTGLAATDPILQVSDIIVHRQENGASREQGVAFDQCFYEPLQAKVSCDGDKLPNRNAFALAVRKWEGETTALVSDVTLRQLNDRLPAASSMTEINRIVKDSVDQTAGRATFAAVMTAVGRMADGATPAAVRSYDAEQSLTVLQCALLAQRAGAALPAAAPDWLKTYADYCGGAGLSRALTMDEFNTVSRRMIELLSFDVSAIEAARLIDEDPKQSAQSLLVKRAALVPLAAPRLPIALAE